MILESKYYFKLLFLPDSNVIFAIKSAAKEPNYGSIDEYTREKSRMSVTFADTRQIKGIPAYF